ncbi:hypothetical protein ACIBSW_39630 [Actinoplanes sp. NPDC049668]|uniref:AfsR/SARP family transcriptional regulator n=1 Tax=unclassified Actinoplanes TaxID=2626549 RepID=UPI0033AD2D95
MNRLATAVAVLIIVIGPPLLAGLWLRHHPWRPPTQAQVHAWLEQPVTAGTIITACVTVAGVAWLLLLTHLTRRALTELRRRLHRMRHLPVPTPAQMTASSMAGIAALTLPATPGEHPPPPPATAGTPQPSDPDPDRAAPHPDQPVKTPPAGVDLPGGGWIPYRTAAAITALAGLAWLHRRRYYRPDPHRPRDHRHDPDLQPLPGAIHTITTAVTGTATTGHDHTPSTLLALRLPEGVLQLTGPGAAAAARGLLIVSALTTTSGDTPAVSVPPSDLRTLLPAGDPTDLGVVDLVAAPGASTGHRTGTLVVLGDDPAATHRWHVTADGTATGTGLTEARRLCTLDPQTTADLLSLSSPWPSPAPVADPPPTPQPGPATVLTAEPGTATAAHLTLLGGCHLSVAEQQVHIRRTAGLQILAYLAVHPDGATRNELTHAIWPHLPAATISQRLHTTLTDLRHQLRPLLGDDPITRHDHRYLLNRRAIPTDLDQWHTAVHAMTHAIGTTAQHHACRRVVELYHGELAAGRDWPCLISAREQARRTVVDACVTLAEHTEPDQALTWLQQAITIDPYNEAVHQHAADLLNAAGDHAGARDLINKLKRRLTERTPTPL